MTVLGLTACMMAWPTAACFNCVFLPTNVFISSILKTLANKHNVFQESIYLQQRGVYIFQSLPPLYKSMSGLLQFQSLFTFVFHGLLV